VAHILIGRTLSSAIDSVSGPLTDAVRTSVAASATDVQLLPANPARRAVLIFNDSNDVLYIGLGSAAVSTTDFTKSVSAQALARLPDGFVGEIRGLWSGNEGAARITELV
jgi:hypothetical protein